MTTVSVSNLRTKVSEITDRAHYKGERFCIEKNGSPACAIVSIEDLQLLQALEDHADIRDALAALRKGEFTSWQDAKAELGL